MGLTAPLPRWGEDHRVPQVLAELGDLPATLSKFPGATATGSSEDLIRHWISDPDAHLLVISGAYGAGKSHLLNKVVRPKYGASIFDHSTQDIPPPSSVAARPAAIFVDHFDEITNYAGLLRRAPDLRAVAEHLRSMKVCLVTNRPLTDKSHEFVRQLRYRSRLDALGVRNLDLLTVEPWTPGRVQLAIDKHLPSASKHFRNISTSLSPSDLNDLLRPMVLRMLLSIISTQPDGWIPEYGEIYEQYLEHALSWSYDQGRSYINSIKKRAVLTSLSYSVFSGRDSPVRNSTRAISIPLKTIEDKLKEAGPPLGKQASDQNSLSDFLQTNGCLVPIEREDGEEPEYKFGSKTIFEYFLAQSMMDRFLKGSGLDIKEDQFNQAILDTRLLYFARRRLAGEIPPAIASLLSTTSLPNLDRLILLYLIEDKPNFISALNASSEEYFTYLAEAGQKNDPHFLVKIARFQLVSSGRMSASEYLDYVELSEEPSHLEVELQICRSPTGNLDYLEARFRNENLRNSAAISIYRITQLDHERAKSLLEGQDFLSEIQARECRDAFTRATASNSRRDRSASATSM